jgi:hypothetical protein
LAVESAYPPNVLEVVGRKEAQLAAVREHASDRRQRQIHGRGRVALLDQAHLRKFEVVVAERVPVQRGDVRWAVWTEEYSRGPLEGLAERPSGVGVRLGPEEYLNGRGLGERVSLGARDDGGDGNGITSLPANLGDDTTTAV